MTRCHVWHDFTQTPGICAINHWYNSKEIQAVLTSLLQKRPTKETYILIGTTFKRSRQCEHLLAVWISLLQKRPTKETYKRDLQKRPTKETYILIGRTSKRCSHCINCSVHTAQIFMSLLEKCPTIDSYFFDGYCSTVQGLLDWFEVDLGFTWAFIYSNRKYPTIDS